MEFIKNYAERIAVFVVLSVYIDIILPDNSYRKYIRLIAGAMLIGIVIEPVSALLKRWMY